MIAPSRRTFLKTGSLTAAAAAAALAFPSGVFAQATTSQAPLRIGIIGTGHRGSVHIASIKGFPQFQIVAACDVRQNHLDKAIGRIGGGGAQPYIDYQKLLASSDIDAVLIATPNCAHKEIVLAALEAGKHVLCEKPMAVTYDECQAMKAAADAKPNLVVLYTMQLRYAPRFAAMRKAIEDGKIGRPLYQLFVEFRGDWNRGDVWQYDDPRLGKINWRFSHAASGGTLSEKSCHFLDLMNWMAGAAPAKVRCDGGIARYKDGRDTWDHAAIVAEYPDGCKATHNLCMFGPNRMDYQITGEDASLLIEDAGPGGSELIRQSKGKRESLPLPAEVPHGARGKGRGAETAVVLMYQDFVDCVRNGKKPQMDADKAMASCKTAWLGELSSESKKEVTWDAIG